MRDRAGLSHVDRVAGHRQPGRDDVVEGDEHADLAVESDSIDPVKVPIGDEEPATVCLYGVLNSARDVDLERDGRWMKQGERADVRNNGEAVWAVHSVDANHVAAADVRADQGDQ